MKLLFSALLLSALLISSVYAGQPIRGFVIDGTSGEPLPVANVMLKDINRGSSTNLDGFFLIPNLNPGVYKVVANYLGYNPGEIDVRVTNKVGETITIELYPASVQLEEVVYTVKEESDEMIRQGPRVSTVPVDGATIRQLPSLGAEMDVLRAIQAIPGVKASSDLSSAPHVRGAGPDMTLILMDQSTVYNPSHMFGIFSTFNADAVKRLELMKGGFPAEYGGRAGSVLEVVTNDGNRKENEGLVSVGLISAKAALEGPLPGNRGSYAISGRRTYFDYILDAVRKSSEDYKDIPNYFFYDGNGKVNIDLTKNTTLTVGGYMGLDKFDGEFGNDDARIEFNTYWGNQTATARLRHVLSRNSFLTVSYALSRYRSGAELWDKNEQTRETTLLQDFRNRFNDNSVRADIEFMGYENHRIKTGIQYNSLGVDVVSKNEDVTFLAIDTTTANYSWYIQDQYRLNALFEIQPGVRAYYHEDGDIFKFDPRLSIVYHHSPEMRIKLAGGRYHQWVNVMSAGEGLNFFDLWFPADGSVDPVYMDQYVFGYEWDFHPAYEFTFETYYNDMKQLLANNDRIDEGKSLKEAFFQGYGYSYGFEFMLRKKVGRLTGWLGYSLSWSKRKYPGSYINDGDWYYPKWDRRNDFIGVVMYKINEKWDVSAQWRYNTGQGYTRAMGVYTTRHGGVDNDYPANDGRTMLYGDKNNYRLPSDHRLDLSANYHHKFFGLPAKLNISVFNAYNRRAVWTRFYEESDNPATSSDAKLLPILPLVGYEVRF